jgi:biopolymer transport protein ExbB
VSEVIRWLRPFAAGLLAALVAAGVQGAVLESATADAGGANGDDLARLLARVQQAGQGDRARFEQRMNEFSSMPEEQRDGRLESVEEHRDSLRSRSDALSDEYSQNELRINELTERLVGRASELGLAEVFGIARQVAGDSAVVLEQSLITTERARPEGGVDRTAFMRSFADTRTIPRAEDLERLWLEIYEEITASGQVSRYTAPVVRPGGESVDARITRIGSFTATTDGQFLAYHPPLRTLSILPRQLPESLMETAARFEAASSGYVPAVVDPSRGVLLGLYVERPTVIERIRLGEAVGYVIIVVGVLGVLAFLYQLVHLIVTRLAMSGQLEDPDHPKSNNPLGRVLLAFKGDHDRIEESSEAAELRITEAVIREVPKLERFQAFLRLAVAAGPLLGLIGTVVGMIITFQSITESGSSDPRLMATGIGQAMIATVLGLGIAIPLLFANALLNALSRGAVQVLEGQSAGILADTIERQHRD